MILYAQKIIWIQMAQNFGVFLWDFLWVKLVQWEGNSSQGNRDSAIEIIAFIWQFLSASSYTGLLETNH